MPEDWIARQYRENRQRDAGVAVQATRSSKPDVAARANVVARKLGIDASVVERNLRDIEEREEARRRVTAVRAAPPRVQEWYANPRNAAAGGADAERMSSLGMTAGLVPAWDAAASRMAPSVKAQKRSSTWLEGLAKIPKRVGGEGLARLGQMATAAYNEVDELREFLGTPAYLAMDALDAALDTPIDVQRMKRDDAARRERNLQAWRGTADRIADQNRGDNAITEGLLAGTASAPMTLGAAAISYLTKSPTMGAMALGGLVGADAVQTAKAEGMDAGKAYRYGLTQGVPEALFEIAPQAKLVELTGKGLLKGVVDYFQTELPSEMATTLVQSLSDYAYKTPEISYQDWAATLPEALAQTALGVVGGGAITVGGIKGLEYAGRGAQRVLTRSARQQQRLMGEIVQARAGEMIFDGIVADVEASQLTANDPEAMAEFVASLTENSPVENVYLRGEDIRELYQDGYRDDPVLGAYADQIDEAIATDGEVVLPVGVVAVGLARTEQWAQMREKARFTPGGMSIAEVRQRREEFGAQIDTLEETVAQAEREAEPTARVYEDTYNRLIAAGRSPRRARADAAILTANRETTAMALGMDAWEYHQQNPVEFRGPNGEGAAAGRTLVQGGQQGATPLDANALAAMEPGQTVAVRDRRGGTVRLKAREDGSLVPVRVELDENGVATAEVEDGIAVPAELAARIYTSPSQGENDGQSDGRGLPGERDRTPLAAAPRIAGEQFGPIAEVVGAAEAYAEKAGIPLARQAEYVEVDPEFAARLADAYEQMEHAPQDPAVAEAYADLIAQTRAQYDALVEAGFTFEFGDPDGDYFNSGFNALRDLRENKRMLVFATTAGFGSDATFDPADNPLNALTDLMWLDHNGVEQPVMANDLFRAVHDAFGHGIEGAGFRAQGEENAWQAHARLFTGPALAALTTETRGQNSWVNYGPNGEANRTASAADTVYADQKTGLLPEWAWTENVAPDMQGNGRTLEQQLAEGLVEGEVAAIAPTGEAVVGWTEDRIDDLLRTHAYASEPERTKAYAVRLSPDQFLGLTASEAGRDLIAERVESEEYGGEIDFERMRSNPQAPFLVIKIEGGFTTALGTEVPVSLRVMGHEGRHRMTMLKKAGVESVPVVIVQRDKNTETPASGSFGPQRSRSDQVSTGDTVAEFEGMQPISYANRANLEAEFGQGRVLFQTSEQGRRLMQGERFYSALERAVEAVKTNRAPAQQWLATLKKAPGVKAEELEWTGLEEWFAEQTGPVEKDDVLRVLRAGAITVEERILGGNVDESWIDERVREQGDAILEGFEWDSPFYVEEVTEDEEGNTLEEPKYRVRTSWDENADEEGGLFDDEDAAMERMWEMEEEPRAEAEREALADIDRDEIARDMDDSEYREYSLVPDGDDSYRELLIHFPWGTDLAREAPSTHFEAEAGIVAHARFHERKGPNGERILFLDEIQSDWHQMGRDQGYDTPADPEVQEKARQALAEAQAAFDDAQKEAAPLREALREALKPVSAVVADFVRAKNEALEVNPDIIDDRVEYNARTKNLAEPGVSFDGLSTVYVRLRDSVRDLGIEERVEEFLPAIEEAMRAKEDAHVQANEASRTLALRESELRVAERGGDIADAPFKNTWPTLAMKSVIVHAAENGFDQIAWIKQGENNGGMNDNVGWFYEKVLPNEVGKLVKKYGTKVEPLRVQGLRVAEGGSPRLAEVKARMETLRKDSVGVAKAVGSLDRIKEQVELAHTRISNRVAELEAENAERLIDVEEAEAAGVPDTARGSVSFVRGRIEEEQAEIDNLREQLTKTSDWDALAAMVEEYRALQGEEVELERNAPTNLGFKISDKLRETATTEGFPLFQNRRGGQGPRGSISGGLISGDDTAAIITVFEADDPSTVIHELGHLFVEELKRNAALPQAPQWMKDDWQALQDWFASKGHPVAPDGTIPTGAHELLARGFERYAMEGKAPVPALKRVFDYFRASLLKLYQVVTNLRSPITPEVRRVFDRMLATQEAIEDATDEQDATARFASAEEAGMSPEEFAAYQQVADAARTEAYDALLFRTMASIRAERTKAYRKAKARVQDEVTDEVNERPEFRALHLLRTGRFLDDPDRAPMKLRLDRAWLVERFGADIEDRLPHNIYPKDNGDDPGVVANLAGFSTAEDMVEALLTVQEQTEALRETGDKRSLRNAMIETETQARMDDRHGNPLEDGSIEEEALAAIHNDRQGELMASENRQLARQTRNQPTAYSLVREWARNKIATGRVVDVASRAAIQRYSLAVRRATKALEAALAAGDRDEAFRQSEVRLLNHALIAEAKKAADRVDVIVPRLKRVASQRARKSVAQEYWNRAHSLLEKFEFRARSQTALDEQENFAVWAQKQAEAGVDVVVPPRLEENGTHYSRMAVSELIALDESVEQLLYLGRKKKGLKDAQEKREYETERAKGLSVIEGIRQRRRSNNLNPSVFDRLKAGLRSFDAALLKMEQVFDWLDGGDPNGFFNRNVLRPLNEAQERERQMGEEYLGKVRELMLAIPKAQIRRWTETFSDPRLLDRETGEPFVMQRQDLISMALNVGNEGNFAKLAGGYGWNRDTIMDVLNKELSAEEWQFVQQAWDLVNTLWPEIEALEKRVNGIAPEKVEPRSFTLADGTQMAGGYYPVVYDPARNYDTEKNVVGDDGKLFNNGYQRATTRQGFTKERTDVQRQIKLSLSVLNRHLNEVIHDITHREAIMQADRILSDRKVMKAVDDALGPEVRKQFRPWLSHVANQWAVDNRGMDALEKIARKMRTNTTIMGMGFRLTSILAQVAGYAGVLERVPARWLASGFKTVGGDPVGSYDFVMERSAEVAGRMGTMERDMNANLRQLQGKFGLLADARRFAFHGIGYMDRVVVIPTWIGAYNQALAGKVRGAGPMSEADAAAYADKIIRSTQGSGSAKDLAAVQRGSEFFKLTTMFYSYASAFYNRQRALGRDTVTALSEKDIAAFPGLLARAWWLMIVSPILGALPGALLSGYGPDDDDDEETTWATWATSALAGNVFYGVPLVRDAVAPLISDFDYSITPAARGVETMLRALGDVGTLIDGDEETEPSTRAVKTGAEAVGYVAGVPAAQLANAAQFLSDWAAGEADPDGVGEWLKGLQRGKLEED